jgi:small subunit ribosomal protein S19e
MVTVYDVNPSALIEVVAKELKNNDKVQTPEWAHVVKTGHGKERLPDSLDWWFMRVASILRKVYVRGPIGVSKLRRYYGVKKNRGVKPERFTKAGGKIIRTCLQQLEAAELVRHVEKGVHKGRVITPKGQAFLDSMAKQLHGNGSNSPAEDQGASREAPAVAKAE